MYDLLKLEARRLKRETHPKALRRKGIIPGVIYGKDLSPSLNIQVEKNDLVKFLHQSAHVFEVQIGEGEKYLVNLDRIDRDPLGTEILHISFHNLARGQKTVVHLPIVLEGEAVGVKAGGVLNQILNEVNIEGLPKDIPETIGLDVSGLEVNHHLCLKDLHLPGDLIIKGDPEDTIVTCALPKKVEEETTTTAESGEATAETPTESPAQEERAG